MTNGEETQTWQPKPFPDRRSTLHPTMRTSILTTGFNVSLLSDRRILLASCSLKRDPKVPFETSTPLSHTENATQELHLRIQD